MPTILVIIWKKERYSNILLSSGEDNSLSKLGTIDVALLSPFMCFRLMNIRVEFLVGTWHKLPHLRSLLDILFANDAGV